MDENTNDSNEKQEGVKDLLKKITEQNELLIEQKKAKRWKLPRRGRVSKGQLKKGFTTVMVIGENRNVRFIKLPIEDGTITLDKVPRMATADYVMTYNGRPIIVIPEWSLKPFSPEENYEQTVREQTTVAGRKLILAKMKMEAISPKKSMGNIGWWLLGIALIAVVYYFMKGGKIV